MDEPSHMHTKCNQHHKHDALDTHEHDYVPFSNLWNMRKFPYLQ